MKKLANNKLKPKYNSLLSEIVSLMETGKQNVVRLVNSELTSSYWEIGRRIVHYEQYGNVRADYGTELLKRLTRDLTKKYGKGFSVRNLQDMRLFYLTWKKPLMVTSKPDYSIWQTVSAKSKGSIRQTVSAEFMLYKKSITIH